MLVAIQCECQVSSAIAFDVVEKANKWLLTPKKEMIKFLIFSLTPSFEIELTI